MIGFATPGICIREKAWKKKGVKAKTSGPNKRRNLFG